MATNNSINTYIVPTTTYEVTSPSQPAFLATKSASTVNATGNGAVFTIDANTEIFDQNADYNNGTYTFTAPVTGRYRCVGNAGLQVIGTADTGYIRIVSSNRTYYSGDRDFSVCKDNTNKYFLGIDVLADADAADTIYLVVVLSGQAGDTITSAFGGATTPYTWFNAYLAC